MILTTPVPRPPRPWASGPPPPPTLPLPRVLITHDRYPPDIRGGGEIVVRETARHLALLGHPVQVLTTGDPRQPGPDPEVPVHRLPVHPYRFNLCAGPIARALRDADVVHTFNYHACLPSLLAARRCGKPVVCTVLGQFGDAWLDLRGPLLGRAWRAWERWQVTRAYDRIIFLSDFSRDQALAWGVDRGRSLILPPGLDHARYRQGPKDGSALFVGKFEVRKGVQEVVALARALPQLPVRMIGWGPLLQPLQAAARELPNLQVQAFEAGERLYEAFARAQLFVFPSHAETFGIVLAEAMASACVVVSSIPLGFEGRAVPAGNAAALVDAVRSLLQEPQALPRLGALNQQHARRFDWCKNAAELSHTYLALLNQGRAQAGASDYHHPE